MRVHGTSEHPYCTLYYSIHLCHLRRREVSKDLFCVITIAIAATAADIVDADGACWCEMTFDTGSAFASPA